MSQSFEKVNNEKLKYREVIIESFNKLISAGGEIGTQQHVFFKKVRL